MAACEHDNFGWCMMCELNDPNRPKAGKGTRKRVTRAQDQKVKNEVRGKLDKPKHKFQKYIDAGAAAGMPINSEPMEGDSNADPSGLVGPEPQEEEVQVITVGGYIIVIIPGHRPDKLGGYGKINPLRAAIKDIMLAKVKAIIMNNPNKQVVIVWGGALGTDQWSAELARHLGVPHVCIIPFVGFSNPWPQVSKDHFKELVRGSSNELAEEFMAKLQGMGNKYPLIRKWSDRGLLIVGNKPRQGDWTALRNVMQKRNMAMVDLADLVIPVYNGDPTGGTANCYGYAVNQGKIIDRIDPNTVEV